MDLSFGYQHEKLGDAVRILMIPMANEEDALAAAYHQILLAFKNFDRDNLSEDAQGHLRKLEQLMNTEGKWRDQAARLSRDQRGDFSRSLWELDAYVTGRYYGMDD